MTPPSTLNPPSSEVLLTKEDQLSTIPLHDGRPGLRTTLPVEIHEPSPSETRNTEHGTRIGDNSSAAPESISENSCNSCLDFISSDSTLDRFHEIITPAGWKLDSYLRNPVFQNAHQYGDIIFTLGRALITEIRTRPSTLNSQPSTCLYQRIQFATDINPMAKIAYGLYRAKFLSAVSVGFIPLRWEDGPPSSSSLAHQMGEGRGDGSLHSTLNSPPSTKQFRRKYLEQELLEVSAVAIPANPNALALGLKSGAVEKSDLRDLADLLRHTLDHHQQSTINHQLIQAVRQLHTILRS